MNEYASVPQQHSKYGLFESGFLGEGLYLTGHAFPYRALLASGFLPTRPHFNTDRLNFFVVGARIRNMVKHTNV